MKTMLRHITDGNKEYQGLAFICPGCAELGGTGLHILPVNCKEDVGKPSWEYDGNVERPTINPSILTNKDTPTMRCHSFLRNGIFEFLDDCAHSMAGQKVPIPDLPDWFTEEGNDD